MSQLRAMHDFRGRDLQKGRRFVEIAEEARQSIERGDFPVASEIRSRRRKPRILVLRDVEGGLYVLEGECRTFSACFHREPTIAAIVLDVDEHREKV